MSCFSRGLYAIIYYREQELAKRIESSLAAVMDIVPDENAWSREAEVND